MPSVAPCPGYYAVFGAVRKAPLAFFSSSSSKTSTTLISACRDRRKNGRSVVGGRCRGRRRHEIVHRGWSLLFLTVSVRFLPTEERRNARCPCNRAHRCPSLPSESKSRAVCEGRVGLSRESLPVAALEPHGIMPAAADFAHRRQQGPVVLGGMNSPIFSSSSSELGRRWTRSRNGTMPTAANFLHCETGQDP